MDSIATGRVAKPLVYKKEFILYESSIRAQELIVTACFRSRLGGGLAAGGFVAMLAGMANSLPPVGFATLLLGAMGNSYALAIMAQRVIKGMATRHVERIVMEPTPDAASATDGDDKKSSSVAALLTSAATVEERVAATPEIALRIRTLDTDRWILLADPMEDDRRASFGEICDRLGLLHVAADTGACVDPALATAILTSSKVVVEERAEPRTDVAELLRKPAGSAGLMFGEVSMEDVDRGAAVAAGRAPPLDAAETIGRRSVWGGMSVLLAGCLFIIGESARDADGVARWKNLGNLKLPG